MVKHIVENGKTRGGILIFLPGVGEIRQCVDMVKAATAGQDTLILPLHANLSNDEQRRVFLPTKSWKVVAATNVAEVRHLHYLPGTVANHALDFDYY